MAMKDFGVTTALIMVCGFIVNLIVARVIFKYIFLTGQHNLFFAAMLAVVLVPLDSAMSSSSSSVPFPGS